MRLAADGQVDEARQALESIPSDAIREWGVEHGQISGRYRSKVIGKTSPVGTPARGPRNASAALRDAILKRDGYTCRYCGLKVIPREVLIAFGAVVGSEHFGTGRANAARHGAALVSWAEVDHVVPFQRGGPTTPANLVTACWACNYGKDRYTVEELGIRDPRERPPKPGVWDGLTSLLPRLEAQVAGRARPLRTGRAQAADADVPGVSGQGPNAPPNNHPHKSSGERMSSSAAIEHDRHQFGEALKAYVEPAEWAENLASLHRLIAWSQNQEQIAHVPNEGKQAVVRFNFVDGKREVFWSVFPQQKGGAKVVILPRASTRFPESVRQRVRSGIEQIIDTEWPTPNATPTFPLRRLVHDPDWVAFRALLEDVLAYASTTRPAPLPQ
jgi:5-methylcytosine-specific restriction endonuclease McrA